MSAHCSSCDAEITWAIVAKSGKKMPVDALSTPDGNIVFLDVPDPSGTPLVAYVSADVGAAPRYKSHFATCPDAGSHRR